MGKILDYYIDLDEKVEKLLKDADYLGKGHNGIVYRLSNGKIIKIFMNPKVCEDEYSILKSVTSSKYFPKVYSSGPYYIIRDYVGGKRLDDYLKRESMDEEIGINIVKMFNEFKKLGFARLDIRCKDVYVQEDKSLMIIDPKNSYSKSVEYPRHLMKGFNKIGVLDKFLNIVKDEYPEYYDFWNYRIRRYLDHNIK